MQSSGKDSNMFVAPPPAVFLEKEAHGGQPTYVAPLQPQQMTVVVPAPPPVPPKVKKNKCGQRFGRCVSACAALLFVFLAVKGLVFAHFAYSGARAVAFQLSVGAVAAVTSILACCCARFRGWNKMPVGRVLMVLLTLGLLIGTHFWVQRLPNGTFRPLQDTITQPAGSFFFTSVRAPYQCQRPQVTFTASDHSTQFTYDWMTGALYGTMPAAATTLTCEAQCSHLSTVQCGAVTLVPGIPALPTEPELPGGPDTPTSAPAELPARWPLEPIPIKEEDVRVEPLIGVVNVAPASPAEPALQQAVEEEAVNEVAPNADAEVPERPHRREHEGHRRPHHGDRAPETPEEHERRRGEHHRHHHEEKHHRPHHPEQPEQPEQPEDGAVPPVPMPLPVPALADEPDTDEADQEEEQSEEPERPHRRPWWMHGHGHGHGHHEGWQSDGPRRWTGAVPRCVQKMLWGAWGFLALITSATMGAQRRHAAAQSGRKGVDAGFVFAFAMQALGFLALSFGSYHRALATVGLFAFLVLLRAATHGCRASAAAGTTGRCSWLQRWRAPAPAAAAEQV